MTRPDAWPTGLILAASSSNSGKTTLSLGLQRLLVRRGVALAPAKCGPDYIDPAFHSVAAGIPSYNLDPWAMRAAAIQDRCRRIMQGKELLFVEGVMGLFDGAAGGQGSTAALARILRLPILLVLDVKGQAQTAAAIAHGIRSFDPELTIGGVLLNRVGSPAHEMLLREAFAQINIPVLGCVRHSSKLELPSRHLGLVQAGEYDALSEVIDTIADHVAEGIDLDAILTMAQGPDKSVETWPLSGDTVSKGLAPLGQHIAIAKDAAFTFLYPHILTDWQEQGARLSFFSPLADEIPDRSADAVYLPGGYPELHLPQLAHASRFKRAMHDAADQGALIFAECGGYMVLGESIRSKEGEGYSMLGLLPLETSFHAPKLSLGYRKLVHASALPWPKSLAAHEFHYATIIRQGDAAPLFDAQTATGRTLPPMGLRVGSVHGSFAHIIAPAA